MSEEKKPAETPPQEKPKLTVLQQLRVPFEPHQISKLPKPFKKDSPKGNCPECGKYHGLPAVHLDYVGHAALTDRLLSVDENWNWKPLALDAEGLPKFDKNGGLWIELTVGGVSRKGYGNADGKSGGDAIKEIIGDALRNAGMRFGCALDLWHKGDLRLQDLEFEKPGAGETKKQPETKKPDSKQKQELDFTKYKMRVKTKDPKDSGKSLAEIGTAKVIKIYDHLEAVEKKKALGAVDAEFMVVAYKFLQSVGHFPPDGQS